MKCPKCKKKMDHELVKIEGAIQKVKSYQCPNCDHFEFEDTSSKKVLAELVATENPLKIRQKIIKLSADRLGVYINKHIIESLDLKAGTEIFVSVPDKKHIVLELKS